MGTYHEETYDILEIGTTIRQSLTEEVDSATARVAVIRKFRANILAKHLEDETFVVQYRYKTPASWWQMFKETYMLTWWLGWFVSRYPVKWQEHTAFENLLVERYAAFPEANVFPKNMGKPTRMTKIHQEIPG